MFIAQLKAPDTEGKIFVEHSAEEIALNLARIDDGEELHLKYFEVVDNGTTLVLKPVKLKTGARTTAPAEELVEIEADGVTVGSASRIAP